jgi:hypothetical protein
VFASADKYEGGPLDGVREGRVQKRELGIAKRGRRRLTTGLTAGDASIQTLLKPTARLATPTAVWWAPS